MLMSTFFMQWSNVSFFVQWSNHDQQHKNPHPHIAQLYRTGSL